MSRWLRWALPALVLVAALAVGASGPGEPPSDAERAQAVAGTVRCPTCAGQSVASSDAVAAREIRAEIDRRVAAGEGDDEIRAALVAAYGDGILMNPPASGVAGLVWVLPVAALVVALAALAVAVTRWRAAPAGAATEADRRVVEEARRRLARRGDAR